MKDRTPVHVRVWAIGLAALVCFGHPAMGSEPAVAASPVPHEDVGPLLVEAIVQVESAGDAQRVGRQGERGLMQVKSSTWAKMTGELYGRQLPFDRAFEPALNRAVGSAYLQYLRSFLQQHRGQWGADERSLLLACYNAGPARVREAGFRVDQLPASTRDYVQRASALHDCLLQEVTAQVAVPWPGENA